MKNEKKIISGIYAIKNKINGKLYIGSAYDIYERWKYHMNTLNKNGHSKNLQNDWIIYGKDCFDFIILEYTELNDVILKNREQFYLDKFESYNKEKGYNISKKANRPNNSELISILQYDLSGKFVKEWKSFREITNNLQIDTTGIRKVCKGNRKTSHECCWIIKEGEIKEKIDVSGIIVQKKQICQFNLNGEFINTYESMYKAGFETNICEQNISKCCRKKIRSCGGFVWRFKCEVNNILKIHVPKKITFSKKIMQFDLFGNFVNEFYNAKDVQKNTGFKDVNIKQSCRDKNQTYGFFWRFKKEVENNLKIDVQNIFVKIWPILQFSKDRVLIREFKSASEVCKKFNIKGRKSIDYICSGKCKKLKKFLFFKKQEEKINFEK